MCVHFFSLLEAHHAKFILNVLLSHSKVHPCSTNDLPRNEESPSLTCVFNVLNQTVVKTCQLFLQVAVNGELNMLPAI